MFIFAKSITKPLGFVVEEAKEIEEGRLIMHGRNINRNDEIGELSRSFHNMKYKLIDIIENSLTEANRMAHSANSLATGNKDFGRKG